MESKGFGNKNEAIDMLTEAIYEYNLRQKEEVL